MLIKLEALGEITGPNREMEENLFNTEEEAFEYAYKFSKKSFWQVLPVFTFE